DAVLVAVSWDEHQIIAEKQQGAKVDTVSGVDESQSDEVLLQQKYDSTFKILTNHLSDEVRQKLWEIFVRQKKCWLRPRGGEVSTVKAAFKVEGSPVKGRLRYLSPEMQAELTKQIDDMLAKGVIRPSKSPWGSPPVFVKKKTGEWRMCLDYRRLNKQMKADAYALPLSWTNLQAAAVSRYYSLLDCKWGF